MKELTTITYVCPRCGAISTVSPNLQDLEDWENGKLAQDAFPYLSAEEREILISGLCFDCQKKIFG